MPKGYFSIYCLRPTQETSVLSNAKEHSLCRMAHVKPGMCQTQGKLCQGFLGALVCD